MLNRKNPALNHDRQILSDHTATGTSDRAVEMVEIGKTILQIQRRFAIVERVFSAAWRANHFHIADAEIMVAEKTDANVRKAARIKTGFEKFDRRIRRRNL